MPIERSNQMRAPDQAGFTLVELMVVVAVVGILAIIATPSMSALVNANRLSGAAGELTSALQVARSEAIRRNARVTVCASTNGTTCTNSTAWTRWIVHGNDNATSTDEVIRDDAPAGSVRVSGPAAGIVFRPSGLIDAQATVTACLPVTQPAENRRVVTVMISGIVSSSNYNGGGTCP
jgi:type IV fimbrial biogenesis protein FimT